MYILEIKYYFRFDIGDIVLQKQIDISEHETLPELYAKLAKLGANLLENVFEDLPQLLQSAKSQNKTNITYGKYIYMIAQIIYLTI